MEIKAVRFSIAKKDIDAALKALQKIDGIKSIKNLQAAVHKLGWHIRIDPNGNAIKLQCLKYNEEDTKKLAEALAPFAKNTVIKIEDEGEEVESIAFADVKPKKSTGKSKKSKKDEEPAPEPPEGDSDESAE